MAYFVGIGIALAVSLAATLISLDRDRAFYPTVLAVIASYYVLFAVMAGSVQSLIVELLIMALFLGATAIGFRRSLWIVAIALGGHGVLDLFHGRLVSNPGVPDWWPMFCLSYDVTAAAYLSWLLGRSRLAAR